MNALCDYRLKEAVRVQFDRFAKGFWRVLGQSSIERVVEAEELRVMVQGDEAPLDWAALQTSVPTKGSARLLVVLTMRRRRLSMTTCPPTSRVSSDPDASDSSGEPLFGAVTEPRVIAGDAPTPAEDARDRRTPRSRRRRRRAAAAAQKRNPRDVPVVKALWAAVAAFDDALQRDFLMFVTGSKTAPMGGLGALRPPAHASFKVQRAGPDSDAPTSHTWASTAAAGVRPSTESGGS